MNAFVLLCMGEYSTLWREIERKRSLVRKWCFEWSKVWIVDGNRILFKDR